MNSVDCPTVFEGAGKGLQGVAFERRRAERSWVEPCPRSSLSGCAPLVAVGTAALSSGTASAETPCSGTVGGMTIFGGSNQVTKVGTAFATSLQVEVVATNGGCPLAGVDVTLGAPATGASASFAGGVIAVTVLDRDKRHRHRSHVDRKRCERRVQCGGDRVDVFSQLRTDEHDRRGR